MKKFFLYLSIVLGVIVFCFVGIVVVLMLAPGTEIFGVKFISAVVGEYETTIRQSFVDEDIYIYADDVPINITFSASGTVGIEYVQHYQGFTRAKDTPEITMLNSEGNTFNANSDSAVFIHVNQYKKFVWANESKDFYFTINLPSDYQNNRTIYVETNNSVVTLSGANKAVNNLTVKTNKSINIHNNLTIGSASFYTQQALTLGENVNIKNSLTAEIPNESLTVVNPIINGSTYGNIKFITAGGNLSFNACQNLYMESGSGCINQPTGKTIYGNLIFKTSSGNIEVSTLAGSEHYISSTAGHITLGTVSGTLNIETNRATVTLAAVNSLNVSTTTGSVNIGSAGGNVVASSSRSGDISCGAVAGNASFKTYTGDITISGAVVGNLTLETNTGDMYFVSCQNLKSSTKDGNLGGYNDIDPVVNGTVDISSEKGSVVLPSILGTNSTSEFDNIINCSNGTIQLNTVVGSLKIDSYNSTITIDSVKKVEISSSYSGVTVKSAVEGAKITNISGKISVGVKDDNSCTVGNLYIKSSEGTISAYNTTGTVELASNKDIVLANNSSEKIYINTTGDNNYIGRGKVTATGLKGDVRVYSEGDVILTFKEISKDVRVDTKGSSNIVAIDATCVSANNVNYWVQSQKGKECYLYYGENRQEIASNYKQELDDIFNTITIISTYAQITLKLADVV